MLAIRILNKPKIIQEKKIPKIPKQTQTQTKLQRNKKNPSNNQIYNPWK